MVETNLKINKTLKNPNIYKEINFLIDVDKNKSDIYNVDVINGILKFKFKKCESIILKPGYSFDSFKNNNYFNDTIILKNDENNRFNYYVFDYSLDSENIVHFNYNTELFKEYNDERIVLGLFNRLPTGLELGEDSFRITNTIDALQIGISRSYVYACVCYNNKKYMLHYKNNYLIDAAYMEKLFKRKYGNILKIKFDEYFKYPFIGYLGSKEKPVFSVKSEDLIICKKKGEIYINPINVKDIGKFFIKAIFKGNIDIEIYENYNWVSLTDKYKFMKNKDYIELRIKLCPNDIISNLCILKC